MTTRSLRGSPRCSGVAERVGPAEKQSKEEVCVPINCRTAAPVDALVKIEGPEPKPAYRQVLVKVAACSLNFRDLGIVRGT
jgi:hypothetical protein